MRLLAMVLVAALAVPAVAAEKAKKDPGERVLCKSFGETGSRTRTTRICKTKAEWEQEEHKAQQELAKQQQRDGGYGQSRNGVQLPGMGADVDRGTTPQFR